MTDLPHGYYIIDGEETPHDADVEDGRYCLYSPDDEPLGNLHDLPPLYALAHRHAGGSLMFFGFKDRAHAVEKLGEEAVVAIEATKAQKRALQCCTRGRGNASTLPYLEDGVTVSGSGKWIRFAYRDGGPPDDGFTNTVLTYNFKGYTYSWSEVSEWVDE